MGLVPYWIHCICCTGLSSRAYDFVLLGPFYCSKMSLEVYIFSFRLCVVCPRRSLDFFVSGTVGVCTIFLSPLKFVFGKWYSLQQMGRYASFCILLVWHIMISSMVYCLGLLMVRGHKVLPLWSKASPLRCLFWNHCYGMQWIASFTWFLAHFHCAVLVCFISCYNFFFLWLSVNSTYWGPCGGIASILEILFLLIFS